jgi:hypothetical protein
MTWAAPIGADLARSLVFGLGADCSTAAALARVMAGRQGYAIDIHNLADWPAAAIQRVTSDFVARGWLSRTDTGWRIGPGQIPSGLVSFLDGVRIPTHSGQGFRFDVGHRSDLIPATIPK